MENDEIEHLELVSDSVRLKLLTVDDVSLRYVGWLNDSRINRYLESRHTQHDLESCVSFVRDCQADPHIFLFGIFFEGEHVGNIKIEVASPTYGVGEIGLLIGDSSKWGLGIGTTVIKMVTSFGFEQLSLERIEAGVYEDNLGSLRGFLKAGYSVEGFFRSSVIADGRRQGCFKLGILKHG